MNPAASTPSLFGLLRSAALACTLVSAIGARPASAAPRRGHLTQQLSAAVSRRDYAAVRALLARKADPNGASQEMSPLMSAAFQGDLAMARLLLNGGADVNAEGVMGNALTATMFGGHKRMAQFLLARGSKLHSKRLDKISMLMMVAHAGDVELLRPILARKPAVDAQDLSGMTALMHATRQGRTEVVRVLLQRGASVKRADREGLTPLMHASMNGHADCARLLLRHGADPEAKDKQGRTALHLATNYGDHPAAVRALLDGGAKPLTKDARGRTPHELAAFRGFSASAAVLGDGKTLTAKPELEAPSQAAKKAFAQVERSMQVFTQRTGCVSCHNEGFARWTTGFARERGYAIDSSLASTQLQRILGEAEGRKALHLRALKDPAAMKEVAGPFGDVTPGYTSFLMGLAAHGQPATEAVTAAAMILGRLQTPSGAWRYDTTRGPIQSSHFTMTAMSVRILQAFVTPEYAPEASRRTARAKSWLLSAPVRSNEDRAFRLLGLKWSGASAGERETAVRDLLSTQRPDGGWSQDGKLQSDAYATGQALFALNQGGELPAADAAFRRGVEFLLRTQDDTGTWYVGKQVMPGNFYFDTGFPYGQSQYISHIATGWAAMALMLASEDPQRQAAATVPGSAAVTSRVPDRPSH